MGIIEVLMYLMVLKRFDRELFDISVLFHKLKCSTKNAWMKNAKNALSITQAINLKLMNSSVMLTLKISRG